MNKAPLSEKEFEVINVLADGIRYNQRALSGKVGISLGMTNLLLRRLVTKGYLRFRQLNRRKAEYLLTTRGLTLKAQKTYHYTLKTIESLSLIRQEIRKALEQRLVPDVKEVWVVGHGDLADLVILALRDFPAGQFHMINFPTHPNRSEEKALIIDASMTPPDCPVSDNTIHLLQTLARQLNPIISREAARRSARVPMAHAVASDIGNGVLGRNP